MVSEEKIFEKVYDNGLRMMAKACMTFGQMSQDNYKYIGTRFLLISVQRVNNHSFTKLVFALKYLGTWIF
jgi:hypothetical protein